MKELGYFIPDGVEDVVTRKVDVRTEKVKRHVIGKDILDIGCGSGYSTREYSKVAKSIIGIDIDSGAVDYAKTHYPSLDIILMDMRTMRFRKKFDVVIATEVLEHISKEDAIKTLAGVSKLLRPDGMFIGSIPMEDDTEDISYHKAFYTENELHSLLERFFVNVAVMSLNSYSPSWFFMCKGVKR